MAQNKEVDEITPLPTIADMTLLDYFAAKAMPHCISTKPKSLYQRLRAFLGMQYGGTVYIADKVAKQSYKQADAMLEERKKYM